MEVGGSAGFCGSFVIWDREEVFGCWLVNFGLRVLGFVGFGYITFFYVFRCGNEGFS